MMNYSGQIGHANPNIPQSLSLGSECSSRMDIGQERTDVVYICQ